MRRLQFGILVIALALVLAPWAALPLRSSRAAHPHVQSSGNHLWMLHYDSAGHGTWDEDICAESYAPTITDSQLSNRLGYLLGNWDGAGNWRVDIWRTALNCGSYAGQTWIDIYAYAYDYGGCGQSSYVFLYNPVYYGVPHKADADIYFNECNIRYDNSSMRSTINHEFGHVLGLSDPYDGNCGPGPTPSVMHQYTYYGCPSGYIETVQSADISSVVSNVMPIDEPWWVQ